MDEISRIELWDVQPDSGKKLFTIVVPAEERDKADQSVIKAQNKEAYKAERLI